MRSQISNSGAQSSGSNDPKKSVFDRLGHQLDTGRPMKRRPSPGPYGDFMPPPVHDAEFGRYPRDPHQAEMEWRYQNERRHMSQFPRERHPAQMQPPPLMHPSHYEMEISRGQPPYYPPAHPYHNCPPAGPLPPPQGPMVQGNPPMSMHQQRSSPKYDRHGNIIVGSKERGRRSVPMDHHPGMSPPRSFMPMGPMMHFNHEMPPPPEMGMGPGRPPVSMYPSRWHEGMEPEFPHPGRMLPDGRFSPIGEPRRCLPQPLMSPPEPQMIPGSEAPRYAKWRERRDVITTLDRETAQSSYRTDSLKSTLQQDGRYSSSAKQSETILNNSSAKNENQSSENSKQLLPVDNSKKTTAEESTVGKPAEKSSGGNKDTAKDETRLKTEPQDISDGEIVDDEDSSDESEDVNAPLPRDSRYLPENYLTRQPPLAQSYSRRPESHQYYESSKKRRLHEDYSMDYETISDEDLDDFMGDKKMTDLADSVKYNDRLKGEEGGSKSISEIELLNALGLDWANLVEMAKQSRTSSKDTYTPGSALPRFSMPNYLPTLAIPADLVGPEIYELILKVCRT